MYVYTKISCIKYTEKQIRHIWNQCTHNKTQEKSFLQKNYNYAIVQESQHASIKKKKLLVSLSLNYNKYFTEIYHNLDGTVYKLLILSKNIKHRNFSSGFLLHCKSMSFVVAKTFAMHNRIVMIINPRTVVLKKNKDLSKIKSLL